MGFLGRFNEKRHLINRGVFLAGIFLIGVGFFAWIQLPVVQGSFWMSPDETANAVSAIQWSRTGYFSFAWALAERFPWAHPRSFVALPQADALVPIGFLGMPVLLGLFYLFFGLSGILFFTPLLALATLYPLWKLFPERWIPLVRFFAIGLWMFVPSVLLYANRGAFAQLPLVCLAVWMWWAIWRLTDPWRWIVGSICFSVALLIRPVEVFWLLPVLVLAWWSAPKSILPRRRRLVFFAIPLLFILGLGALLGFFTYDAWFVSGYQLRPVYSEQMMVSAGTTSVSAVDVLPFSIHPRNLWWNVRSFLIVLYWPWMLLIFSAFLHWWFFGKKNREAVAIIFAIGVTAFWLIGFYGNGLYHDHLDPNAIRVGNSFLRYLLPLSLAVPISAGYLGVRAWKYWSLRPLVFCCFFSLLFFGYWMGYGRDDEGIFSNTAEFLRYQSIRSATTAQLDPEACVFSDRSDKVFFPTFCAVSPMPEADRIRQFLNEGGIGAFWLETLSAKQMAEWKTRGFTLLPIFTNANQTLYHVE